MIWHARKQWSVCVIDINSKYKNKNAEFSFREKKGDGQQIQHYWKEMTSFYPFSGKRTKCSSDYSSWTSRELVYNFKSTHCWWVSYFGLNVHYRHEYVFDTSYFMLGNTMRTDRSWIIVQYVNDLWWIWTNSVLFYGE